MPNTLGRPRLASKWPTLRRLMDAEGYTEASLAKAIGKGERTVQAYLAGDIAPPLDVLEKIVHVLKTTEVELRKDGPLPPVAFFRQRVQ